MEKFKMKCDRRFQDQKMCKQTNPGPNNSSGEFPKRIRWSFMESQHNKHPLAHKYATYCNAFFPQSNRTAGLSSTTYGIEGKISCWKEGDAMRERNRNTQNFEPVGNSRHKHLPDKHAEKLEDDLQEVPPKKRKSSWILAGVNTNNHGTDQEPSKLGNHSTAHDSSNSNARLESMVVVSSTIHDVTAPPAQTGGGEMIRWLFMECHYYQRNHIHIQKGQIDCEPLPLALQLQFSSRFMLDLASAIFSGRVKNGFSWSVLLV